MRQADRISVWAFRSAPEDVRSLYRGEVAPEWIAFIPQDLHDPEIESAIRERCASVVRYEVPDGFLYMGSSSLGDVMALVGPESKERSAAKP